MITTKNVEQYHRDGFLHVEQVFNDDEVSRMRSAVDGVVERAVRSGRDENHTWEGVRGESDEGESLQLSAWHNLEYHSADFLDAVRHPRIVEVLTNLIGPNVVLHHSKMLVKPPSNGAPFPMHQDHPYFPHEQHTMLAASIHLDDADEENGCLHLIPGSHKGGELTHEGAFQLNAGEYPLEAGEAMPARAGDVVFFNYLTVHGSGTNRSQRTRRNLLVQYRAADDKPTQLEHIDWGLGLVVAGHQPDFHSAVPEYTVQKLGQLAREGNISPA